MSAEQYNINSAERALENVMHHEQYLLWYDSTPAGRARQHGNSQQKKTKLDGAHTNENMVENTSILPHQNTCIRYPTLVSIKNSLPSDPYSNTNISSQQQQGISEGQNKAPAPADIQELTMAKTGFGLTAAVTPVTVRATCTKDRHSKVRTAKGLRDRRVRLSAPTAVRFFDVQDRLGYDQPSKAMDWLIQKAQAAIKDLAPVKPIALAFDKSSIELEMVIEEINRCKDPDEQCEKEDQQSVTTSSSTSGARAISRVQARDRAKEKSNKGNMVPTEAKTSALPPRLTAPAISMSPEILLSQFPQPISEAVLSHLIRPLQQSIFSSDAILPQSTTSHIMAPPTHFFHLPHKENAPFIFHDFPTPLSSATSSYYINNNTLISPRGTLQSIFIDSITSPVPVMQYDMMGPHGGTCEAVGASSNRSTGTPVDLCVPLSNHNEEFPKMHLTPP